MHHPATFSGLSLLAAAGLLLSMSSPAPAQDLYDAPSPTRGVLIPNAPVAGDADATAIETNPGQLGLVDSTSTALVADLWPDGTTREGRGGGLFYAAPSLGGLRLGASLQWLHPSLAAQPSNYGKLALGAGFRLSRAAGFGLAWEHLFRSRYAGTDSFAAGIGWRPHPQFAVGLAGFDLFRPRAEAGGVRVPREGDFELTVRPLGTPRLELAGGIRVLESGGDAGIPTRTSVGPRGRFSLGLLTGLALFGELDSPGARLAVTGASGVREARTEYRALLGLSASLDRLVVGAAGVTSVHGGGPGPTPDSGPGASLVLQSFASRRPALIALPYVARVRLSGLEGDRSFIERVVGLRRLGDDPSVGAVLVQLDHVDLGYGRIEELRTVFADLNSRKPVFFWLAQPTTGDYYLASIGTAVAIHPAGDLFLGGLASTVTFFKRTLDQLGVGVDLVRIAEYKGAMEPFVFNESTGPVRENRNALLDDLYSRLKSGIARARASKGIDAARAGQLFDQGLFSAAEAKDVGLVDEVADERQMDKFVEKQLHGRWAIRDADWGRIETGRWRPRRVAIILVDGAITDGRPTGVPSPVQGAVAWSDPILDAIEAVRRDPSVGAVVLRVNSPGGSAFASDRIAREIVRLRESHKPVIVSMGDTAASGGYYIAAPGDTIIASPSAVTGSIGIYAFKLDVANLIGKVGISTESYTRGGRADLYSMYRPWRADEKAIVNARITTHYRQFLKTVASGRKDRGIDETRANDLGRGHVYTGAQALALGLVDQLGGIGAAIDEAARRAGIPTGSGGLPDLVVLPNAPTDPLETLLALRRLVKVQAADRDADAADASMVSTVIARLGRPAARLLLPLLLGPPDAIQARMPYDLEIR